MAQNRNKYRNSRRHFLRTAGATATVGSLTGCIQIPGMGGGGDGGLTIGFYGPFSGPTSNIGQQKRTAAEITRDMINEEGGVHGEDIELVFGDSESQPAAGRNVVNRMIQRESADIIGGGFHSDVALAVVELTAQQDTPQIIDEAVSREVLETIIENEFWNAFKTAPPSASYAVGWRELITLLQERGHGYFPYEEKTISLIAEDTSYGLSIMELMKEAMNEIGWEVISENVVNLDATNFRSLLSRIQSNDPNIVWAVQTSSSGSGNLARQFSQTGFQETHFLHNYGLTIGSALDTAGDAANGAITLLNAGPIPDLLKEYGFMSRWNEQTDLQLTGSVALSYQNIRIIAEMVRSFESLDAFRSASTDEWAQQVINHDPITGGTGYIDYQDNHQAAWGDVETQPQVGYQIIDQALSLFWPSEFATTEFNNSIYQ